MNYEKVLQDSEKMIWKLTNNFYGVDKEDLYQAGVLGLLKALKNYKKDSKCKFSSYAYEYIFGEMYLLASNKTIKISKDILSLYKKLEETRYKLAQKIKKIPSNKELANYLNLPLDEVEMALLSGKEIMSLDTSYDNEKDEYEHIKGYVPDIDTKILIDDSLNCLTSEEKSIMKKRYFEDLTQNEVARKLNMSQVMVSRYEKKSINKMRDYLTL